MCFQGDCTKFESAPYSRDLSLENCKKMLTYTFQTQVGPYYEEHQRITATIGRLYQT